MIHVIDNILDVAELVSDLDAVIFDLDDTLYSEKEYVRSGYHEIAKHFWNIQNMEEKLWSAFSDKKQAINEVLLLEGYFNEETLRRCLTIYREHIPRINLYPGVREMLLKMKHGGKKLGLITDGRSNGQRNKIESLHLYSVFDEIIVTDELGGELFRKPNPRAFELMKMKLGVPYERMCYIGDNMAKDFVAPQQLAMNCFWFRNPDGLYSLW